MPKRLVICCDGTWNRPDEVRDHVLAPTNVAKIALGLARNDDTGDPQVLHYEAGVGTRRLEHLVGGAFGYGLSRNVRNCYRFLVDNYEPGDKLYFFGFSRGAYTARSTVGLVRDCGILERRHRDRIGDAYRFYRAGPGTAPRTAAAEIFRRQFSHPDARIHFIGVFDTVGSLGIPMGPLRPPLVTRLWRFHDTALSSKVDFAFHALSIDEKRRAFKPTLWSRQEAPGQTMKQVWFAGVHSDVGGGYAEPALSEIALLWMVDRARECGLVFESDHFVRAPSDDAIARDLGEVIAPDALGCKHESYKGLYRLVWPYRRPLNADCQAVASSATRRGDEPAGLDAYEAEQVVDTPADEFPGAPGSEG